MSEKIAQPTTFVDWTKSESENVYKLDLRVELHCHPKQKLFVFKKVHNRFIPIDRLQLTKEPGVDNSFFAELYYGVATDESSTNRDKIIHVDSANASNEKHSSEELGKDKIRLDLHDLNLIYEERKEDFNIESLASGVESGEIITLDPGHRGHTTVIVGGGS